MHQDKNQAVVAQAEPEQGQRQQGNGRQRVEHRGQGAEQVTAELGRDRQGGQAEREDNTQQIPLEQHHQGNADLGRQFAGDQAVVQGHCGLQEAGQQQVVSLVASDSFPGHRQQHQDQPLAQPGLLPQALAQR
ncbi:hypothetical protein D3C77_475280 [compost metagenome]